VPTPCPTPAAPPIQARTAFDEVVRWAPPAAAVAAAFAAFFASRNAKNGRRAANAALLVSVLKDYASDDIQKALARLKEFKRLSNHPQGFAQDYAQRLGPPPDPTVTDVDTSRRRLARFFAALRTYCSKGLLDRDLVAASFGVDDFKFVRDVLHPIDKAHQEVNRHHYYPDTRNFVVELIRDFPASGE
jgi:hypothetical protein